MDKVLFLDLDGVLNTIDSRDCNMSAFDPNLVDNLYTILQTTGARIVVSSSWRFGGYHIGSDIYKAFSNACKCLDNGKIKLSTIMDSIVGVTIDAPCSREQEVLYYVEEFDIKKFVALDDMDTHFPSNPNWLILTDDRDGLNNCIVNEVIGKLN
jgi:hypothetical protein